jgi:hypothetical protein
MHPRLARVVGEVVRIVLDHALWRIGLEDAIGQPVRFAIAMASSLESKHICTGRWVSTERPPHQWLDRFGPVRSTHDLVSAMERIADLAAACMRAVVINGEPSGDPFGPIGCANFGHVPGRHPVHFTPASLFGLESRGDSPVPATGVFGSAASMPGLICAPA